MTLTIVTPEAEYSKVAAITRDQRPSFLRSDYDFDLYCPLCESKFDEIILHDQPGCRHRCDTCGATMGRDVVHQVLRIDLDLTSTERYRKVGNFLKALPTTVSDVKPPPAVQKFRRVSQAETLRKRTPRAGALYCPICHTEVDHFSWENDIPDQRNTPSCPRCQAAISWEICNRILKLDVNLQHISTRSQRKEISCHR